MDAVMELKYLHKICILFLFCILCSTSSKEIPTVKSLEACDENQPLLVTESLAILPSPKFNNFNYYPANQNCSWTLRASEGKVWILRSMYFGLNMDCNTDALYIFDGEHKQVGQYCGYYMPARYKSKGNVIHLKFVSGRSPRNVGFQFLIEQDQPTVSCADDETICRHETKCVAQDSICDGVDDCGDGTDEQDCGPETCANSTECGVPRIKPALQVFRVVGGTGAEPGSWPWQASLRLVGREPFSHHCGAVLVDRQWLLTAGHCFKRNLDVQKWSVLMGKHFKLVPEETEQVRYIESIHVHPGYRLNETRLSVPWLLRKQHDIALVKLNAPVTITDCIIPVCLPAANQSIPPGTACYVTGWGETYGTGSELELKQAEVPTVSLELCRKWHRFMDVGPGMLCAGHEEGGHDSCQGDSGGPLVYSKDRRTWHLAGIVSTGGSICAHKEQPGIYTLVSYYIDWIEEVMGNN